MTTWPWAQLEAGSYGLPGPAVVMSPWVLTTRVARPRRRGFTRVTNPARWSRVRQARDIVADYPDPWDLLVISASKPDTVDGDGLRRLDPAAERERRPGAAGRGVGGRSPVSSSSRPAACTRAVPGRELGGVGAASGAPV